MLLTRAIPPPLGYVVVGLVRRLIEVSYFRGKFLGEGGVA